jgi:type I restriction enzyme, S subunit
VNRELVDSGVEWIGEIPKHWDVIKVKRKFKYKKELVKDRVKDFDRLALTLNGVIKRSKVDNAGLQPEKFEGYQILRKNNLVFKLIDLENVNTSRVGLSPYDGIVSPAYIRLINDKEARYGYYYFKSLWQLEVFNKLGGSGVRSNLTSSDLLNLPYLDVPWDEQQKIANYLDEKVSQIDSIIEKTKQSIEELKKYRRTLITETVTRGINPNIEMKDSGIEGLEMVPKHWNIVKLRYLIQFQPPKSEIKEKNIECTFLPMEKLKNGKMVLDENRIIDEVYTGYTYFKENDIVLAKVTPCFENGNIAIAKNLTNSIGFGTTEIYTLRAKKISKEFLFYALQDERFKNEGISSMYGTGGLKRVPGNFILNYKVLVPSNTEQQQIVDFLNEKTEYIENLIIKKKELLNEMESYKKSLIHEYVTGKKEVM